MLSELRFPIEKLIGQFEILNLESKVSYRGRLAPSPTGYLHAGHAPVRGADLLRSTFRQLLLYRALELAPLVLMSSASVSRNAMTLSVCGRCGVSRLTKFGDALHLSNLSAWTLRVASVGSSHYLGP